ncbi:MAG TPA: hypothetical protein VEX86_07985 [Longimicrobium sp.]|nr:hypothetical protein [Longimicrobium sp.]
MREMRLCKKGMRVVWAWTAFSACATLPAPALAQDDSLAVDRAVFEAVIRDIADSVPEIPLVDVRPVRSDQHPALLMLFDAEDLETADPALAASRTSVLERLAVQQTDALVDHRCFWGGDAPRVNPRPGARPPVRAHPDSAAAVRRACQARPPFVALNVGRPQPVEDAGGAAVRVFVVRATASSYEFGTFTLRRDDSGAWAIIERRQILRAGPRAG